MRDDKIISALIGLVGACDNNPKTDGTDDLVIKALAFPLLCPGYDDKALRDMVDAIHSEKNAVAPGCAVCTAPCGHTSDYDMRRMYEADDGIRNVKLQMLEEIRKLAVCVYCDRKSGKASDADNRLFYKALSYVSYDMEEVDLLGLLKEVKRAEQDMKSGGEQNDPEDHKN